MTPKKTDDLMLKAAQESGLAISSYEEIDFSGFGKTKIESIDVKPPRIIVLNGQSDAVTSGLGKVGEIWNTGINRSLGNKLTIIPLTMFVNRLYVKDQQVECRSRDTIHGDPGGYDISNRPTTNCSACRFSKWAGRGIPPECDLTYNYPVLYKVADGDQWQPGFISLKATSRELAKRLNSDHLSDRQPWFFYQYELTPIKRQNDKYTWFLPDIRRIGLASAEDRETTYAAAKALAASQTALTEFESASASGDSDPMPS